MHKSVLSFGLLSSSLIILLGVISFFNLNNVANATPTLPALPIPEGLIIKDSNLKTEVVFEGKLQNSADGPDPDDTGVIMRGNPDDGSPAPDNHFADNNNELSLLQKMLRVNPDDGSPAPDNHFAETPYEATVAKLQPGGDVKYCYSFSYKFGSKGSGEGQFDRPHDIIFDSKGFLYVNDRELNTFQKFTPDGKYISQFGEKGSDLGQYSSPYSMAIDANDNIYVLDRGNDRIVKVDTEGNVLGALYSYDGQWITNNDQIKDVTKKNKDANVESTHFNSSEAMAIDKNGNFYVTDTGNNRIIKFDKNFKYVSHFGEFGSEPGQFDHPHGIGIDSNGNLYINELNNPRIQKFTNDGKFIKEWGSEGTGPGQFTLPLEHLKVDPADRVFITDGADNPRVQVFDTDGKFLTTFGEMGSGDGQMKKPEHVAFDAKDKKGTVYVVDRGNQRMQAFLPCQESAVNLTE